MKLRIEMINHEIINVGLEMAMEFGSNYGKPINERLKKKYADLKEDEINGYNSLCQAAMSRGHQYIYNSLEALFDKCETITEAELKNQLAENMQDGFSWISESNLSRLFSQSCYYAWKDGLDKAIM